MANYYASTTGLSSNSGAIGSPWDLRTALSNNSQTSGDTLYLRGGTYTGRFISTLDGGTVRPYPGESAKIDGHLTTTLPSGINSSVTTFDVTSTTGMYPALVLTIDDEDVMIGTVVDSNTVQVTRGWNGTVAAVHSGGATVYHKAAYVLTITGTNTTYRDLEVFSSSTLRDHQTAWAARASGIGITVIGGDGNSIINNIVHDTEGGIFTGSSSSNTLSYGNLCFNNGYISPDNDPGGMGIYAENVSGYSRVYRNLFLNSFNGNGQFGGDGAAYTGGDHQHNVFANSGAPAGELTVNYLGRAEGLALNVTNNHFFQPHENSGGSASLFGYGDAISALTLSNNYMLGGVSSCIFLNIDTISGSGNNLFLNDNDFGDTQMFYTLALLPTGTFNNNTYHKAQGRNCFGKQGVGYVDFAQWKTDSGFDAASSQTNVNLPDTVVVIPNEYEAGRAHVVIYATSNPATIDVDLSDTELIDGQAYTIKNAFDYFGTEVATGVYDAGDPIVTLNLADMDGVATPTGRVSTPDTTVPDFAALVVEPGALTDTSSSTITNAAIRNVSFS